MPLAIGQANQVPQETQEAYLQTTGWREKAQKMQESSAERRVKVAEQTAAGMKAEAQEKQEGAQGANTAAAVAGTLGGVAGTLALLGVGAEATVVGVPVGLALQAVAALSLVAAGICGIFAGTKTGNAQESLAGADKIVKAAGDTFEKQDNDHSSIFEKIEAQKAVNEAKGRAEQQQEEAYPEASLEGERFMNLGPTNGPQTIEAAGTPSPPPVALA